MSSSGLLSTKNLLRFSLAGLALALTLAPTTSNSATVLKLDTAEMTKRAERIVHGKVVAKESHEIEGSRQIFTEYRIQVTEAWKGADGQTEIAFKQLGGKVAGRGYFISGAAEFEVGQEVVAFLDRPNPVNGCAFTIGLAQGKFDVELDPSLGVKRVRRKLEQLDLVDAVTLQPTAKPGDDGQPLGKLREKVQDALARFKK